MKITTTGIDLVKEVSAAAQERTAISVPLIQTSATQSSSQRGKN